MFFGQDLLVVSINIVCIVTFTKEVSSQLTYSRDKYCLRKTCIHALADTSISTSFSEDIDYLMRFQLSRRSLITIKKIHAQISADSLLFTILQKFEFGFIFYNFAVKFVRIFIKQSLRLESFIYQNFQILKSKRIDLYM